MGAKMNLVVLEGRLGADAEKRGEKFITFSLATSSSFKNKNGEWQQTTQWHNCSCNVTDKVFAKLKKGTRILLQGSINYSKSNGSYFTNIRADRVTILTEEIPHEKQKYEEGDIRNDLKELNEQTDDLPF